MAENKEEKREISPKIKDHYKVVGVQPGEVHFHGRIYDLRTISKETADKLVENKFPYLKSLRTTSSTSSK